MGTSVQTSLYTIAWGLKLPFNRGSCLVNSRKASAVAKEVDAFLRACSNGLKSMGELIIFLVSSTPDAMHDSILLIWTIADAMYSLRRTRALTGNKINCTRVATVPPVARSDLICSRIGQYGSQHTNHHRHHSLVEILFCSPCELVNACSAPNCRNDYRTWYGLEVRRQRYDAH